MAQITSVTSESLQAKIRELLPSQQGFGEDLQATNVITPVIDLTSAAEGSGVGENLQTALAFGSITSFSVANTTTTLANSAGFWRIFGNFNATTNSGGARILDLSITDGVSTKIITKVQTASVSGGQVDLPFDFVVFLRAGDSVTATSNNNAAHVMGCYRQIADVNGVLVNPVGFTPQ